jgi:hypothetical protein
MNSTSYRIDVIGIAWQGFRGSYSRPLTQANWDTIGHPDALKPWFPDFEFIHDYRVTRCESGFTRAGNKSVSTHSEEIVRDWSTEDNAMAFEEMHR